MNLWETKNIGAPIIDIKNFPFLMSFYKKGGKCAKHHTKNNW